MSAPSSCESARAEAERHLAASAARRREVLASMWAPGHSEAGRHDAGASPRPASAAIDDFHDRRQTACALRERFPSRET
jgi:hypothetical protein